MALEAVRRAPGTSPKTVAAAENALRNALTAIGGNMFAASPNSGIPQIGVASTGGRGNVTGGVLEGSNVDIAFEFSNLIIAQRAFQAGARTITTADTILAEAVNLIR